MYRVQSILDKKIQNNQVLYKIKWENYPISQSTWEPIKNLRSVKSMVQEFQNKCSNKYRLNIKSKNGTTKGQGKTDSKPLVRNRSKSQTENISEEKPRKILKKSLIVDEKTEPNEKSSSLEDYYLANEEKMNIGQDIEQLNLSFLSAKINELTQNKKSLKIVEMFKGDDNKFMYEVEREGGSRNIVSREYLLRNNYEDQLLEFYQSRIQFQPMTLNP